MAAGQLPNDRRTAAAVSALCSATAFARAGDHQHARELCASVLFDVLPMAGQHRELLRRLVHALLVAHGFKLLSLLISTLTGRQVRFLLRLDARGLLTPGRERAGREVFYTFDPRWLVRLKDDDPFVLALCSALIANHASDAGQRPAAVELV